MGLKSARVPIFDVNLTVTFSVMRGGNNVSHIASSCYRKGHCQCDMEDGHCCTVTMLCELLRAGELFKC